MEATIVDKSNARDTNFFTKFYKLLMLSVDISKWKSYVNNGLMWKLIKSWSHQKFVKML